MEPKRLNKFISDAGFCSRREADELLEQGRVTVNGKIPQPGTMVTAKDKVRIDDELLNTRDEAPVFLVMNKAAGIATTSDTSARNNIISALNHPASLKPIGLMDRDAEGLIFLSNDSELVNRMTKGDYKYEKEYVVTVDKIITPDFLKKIGDTGTAELGEEKKLNQVSKLTPTRFRIVLEPGTNHHVKRLVEALGYKLVKLKRTRVHNISLGKLAINHWRTLTEPEVADLRKVLSSKVASRAPAYGTTSGKPSFSGRSNTSRPTRGAAAKPGQSSSATTGKRTSSRSGDPTNKGNRGATKGPARGASGRSGTPRKTR
ncbi:pseudouridine synthase [Pontibacter harenae]|uniref:pseudouridine synthase n=1 Tax=Pontibacter harenae TaxID=2894083 RepID=UPI001E59B094|nr:pseudouridine synthase [Pontibacter harenae]MCC9167557.1 pseudouridine synthase [Pontibacter harenae]